MSEAVAVSDDALKILVAEHGVRGTARLLGMDERQTETFKRRVSRAGWLNEPHLAALRAKSSVVQTGRPALPIVSTLSPTAALSAELTALGSESRVSIARTVARAGKHFETMPAPDVIEAAGNLKSIAQTADLVHGWKDAAPQVKIRLDVLSGSTEAPIVDVAADVSDSWIEESASTDLDDY